MWANDYKVSVHGRAAAVQQFGEKLRRENSLKDLLWTLSGVRLVCHCLPSQSCHGDEIVREFQNQLPAAFDREEEGGDPPEAAVLDYLSRVRRRRCSDGSGWMDRHWRTDGRRFRLHGKGGVRRYVPGISRAAQSVEWLEVAEKVREFARREGPPELLMKLALGQVNAWPFPEQAIRSLKDELIASLAARGKVSRNSLRTGQICRSTSDSWSCCWLDASGDPEVGLGSFSQGVRIGVGARLARLPAHYKRKKKWRLASQSDPRDNLDDKAGAEGGWRSNNASIDELADKVEEVMEDQPRRVQVIKLSESEARSQFPDMVVASPGAQRKEKAGGVVAARVLFDGTHGISMKNVLPLQLTSGGFLGRRAEQASELLPSQRTSQRLIARSQSTGGTGTCSARKSAPEGQKTSVLSAPLGWPQHPITGQE